MIDQDLGAAAAQAREVSTLATRAPPQAHSHEVEAGPGPRGAGRAQAPPTSPRVQVYAPELDPVNLQKRPQLRLPETAAPSLDVAANAPPSLQVYICTFLLYCGTFQGFHSTRDEIVTVCAAYRYHTYMYTQNWESLLFKLLNCYLPLKHFMH